MLRVENNTKNNTTNKRQCPHLVSLEHSYVPLSYVFHSSPDLNQQSPTENSEKYYQGVYFYYVLKPVKSTVHVSAYCPLTKTNYSARFMKIAYAHTGQKNYKKGDHLCVFICFRCQNLLCYCIKEKSLGSQSIFSEMVTAAHFVRILPMAALYSSHTRVDGLALRT